MFGHWVWRKLLLVKSLIKLHLIPSAAPLCKSFLSLLAIFCLFRVLAMSFYCHSLVLVLVRPLPKTSALQDVNPYDTLLVNPGLLAAFLNLFYMHQMEATINVYFSCMFSIICHQNSRQACSGLKLYQRVVKFLGSKKIPIIWRLMTKYYEFAAHYSFSYLLGLVIWYILSHFYCLFGVVCSPE